MIAIADSPVHSPTTTATTTNRRHKSTKIHSFATTDAYCPRCLVLFLGTLAPKNPTATSSTHTPSPACDLLPLRSISAPSGRNVTAPGHHQHHRCRRSPHLASFVETEKRARFCDGDNGVDGDPNGESCPPKASIGLIMLPTHFS